jgi:hypothetical protein
LKAQTPAEGILKTHDWGDSKWYKVVCGCGNEDDAIDFEVEADVSGITVNMYTTQKTDYWTEAVSKRYDIENIWYQEFDWFWKDLWNGLMTKLRLTKNIWWDGHVRYQSTTTMTEQQALNYAETLKSAVKDVKEFRSNNDPTNKAASKIANEGDCI